MILLVGEKEIGGKKRQFFLLSFALGLLLFYSGSHAKFWQYFSPFPYAHVVLQVLFATSISGRVDMDHQKILSNCALEGFPGFFPTEFRQIVFLVLPKP